MDATHTDDQQLAFVAVLPRRAEAEVRDALVRTGAPPSSIRFDRAEDERSALRAEQAEEAGTSPPDSTSDLLEGRGPARALTITVPAAAAIGALVALPLAIFPLGDLEVLSRLLICAVAGAMAGSTIALVVTTAMGSKDPLQPPAVDAALIARVADTRPEVRDALLQLGPERLDLVDAGGAVQRTLVVDGEQAASALDALRENVDRERAADPAERHR